MNSNETKSWEKQEELKEIEKVNGEIQIKHDEERTRLGIEVNPMNVEDCSIDGINWRDAPDFCDAFISEAFWSHSGHPLTEDELIELGECYPDFVQELIIDRIY